MKIYRRFGLALLAVLASCAAVVPAELRDAREAYDRSSRGPAAQLKPAELHTAHEALLAAEASWHDDATGFRTLDLAYVAQRKAEIADGQAGIAVEEKSKLQAQGDLTAAQTKLVENTKAELTRTKGDLTRTRTDLQASQVTAAAAAGQLTAEQVAHREAERRAADSQATNAGLNVQITAEQQKRKDAEKRAVDAQAALSRLAAVKQEDRGLVITLSGSVLFRSDESMLLPEARVRLDQVADALLETKERTLVVEGHTDSQGSVGHNNELSQRRATAVRDYLTGRGYPAAQTSAMGYGSQRPVANNKSAEGRANNRRVEIVVTPLKSVQAGE